MRLGIRAANFAQQTFQRSLKDQLMHPIVSALLGFPLVISAAKVSIFPLPLSSLTLPLFFFCLMGQNAAKDSSKLPTETMFALRALLTHILLWVQL